MADAEEVRKVIGDNVERIRRIRGLNVRDFSARLKGLGLSLSASGVSDVENAVRKVSAEELLIFAIALNTSVIDLLTPPDGKLLKVADKVDPLPASWLESWLSGEKPWPPVPTNSASANEFFDTASEFRRRQQRTELRPEIGEIGSLRDTVASAIDGPGPLNEITDPGVMAKHLRDQLERVDAYVKLLADHLEKNGYASRST
ncbi:MAG: helix-turn-helix domain-containing protein [Mycobacterium sp.]